MGASLILWCPAISIALLLLCSTLLVTLVLLSRIYRHISFVAVFLAGFLYALLACQHQIQSQLNQPQSLTYEGMVASLPKFSTQKVSFISKDLNNNKSYLLNWYTNNNHTTPDFKPGQIYQLEVNLKPPSGTVNGVGFDREKWLFRNRIDAVGTIKSFELMQNSSHHLIHQWRQYFSTQIEHHFSTNSTLALIKALSIGDKSHFEHEDFQRFQQTGTAHLIAISGLHIGMVALIGWLLGNLCFWLWPQQKLSKITLQVICGLIMAFLYAGLAGFAISTQRALIMLLVYAYFKLTKRNSYAWDVWSFSLLAVLLLDPLNVLDTGFWLSFCAVAVLIVCFQGIKQQRHKLVRFFTIQWRLLIGMLPLTLLTFSQINLLTPLVNMVMIPLMTFVLVPLVLLMMVSLTFLSFIPNWLIDLLDYCCQWFLVTLDWLAVHAVVPVNFVIENIWQALLFFSGIVILMLPKAIPQKFWGILPIFLATLNHKASIPDGHFRVSFFDVGQGLAVHVTTANHNLLYDVGAAYDSGFNMADAVLLPYFKQNNIHALDTLILSHQDNDHSGAAEFLLSQLKIASILGTEEKHQPCITGVKWQWDQVNFTIISPYNLQPYLKNNSSCVLKIENADGFAVLLTGDIESPVEYRLAQLPENLIQSEVLLIPHHGSKTSSTESFIKVVNPKIAINSSGQYNPFNHPAKEVLEAYQHFDIPVFDTQSGGMITLSSQSGSAISQLRQTAPKIWRKKSPE
ncbi:MAG: DNA internalization-related competence protein ComEC/Rec2 [Xanthomonadales bacterium]|nr:DNA internalization-related competence protein ComEC/Rec2 [Xanthomonadales bacterium]